MGPGRWAPRVPPCQNYVAHLRGQVHGREEVCNEPQEDGRVCADDLGGVEVSQRSHEHGLLVYMGVAALELAGDQQNGLDGAETPVVVELVRGAKKIKNKKTEKNGRSDARRRHVVLRERVMNSVLLRVPGLSALKDRGRNSWGKTLPPHIELSPFTR